MPLGIHFSLCLHFFYGLTSKCSTPAIRFPQDLLDFPLSGVPSCSASQGGHIYLREHARIIREVMGWTSLFRSRSGTERGRADSRRRRGAGGARFGASSALGEADQQGSERAGPERRGARSGRQGARAAGAELRSAGSGRGLPLVPSPRIPGPRPRWGLAARG